MPNNKWDHRFIELAQHVARWSKDPSTQVGAVIVDSQHRIVSVGFNGPPAGTCDAPGVFEDRDEKLRRSLHAEDNALMFARRDVSGMSLYVTRQPCARCAARIIQAGIACVYHPEAHDAGFTERWAEEIASAQAMFSEAGVMLWSVRPPLPTLFDDTPSEAVSNG